MSGVLERSAGVEETTGGGFGLDVGLVTLAMGKRVETEGLGGGGVAGSNMNYLEFTQNVPDVPLATGHI